MKIEEKLISNPNKIIDITEEEFEQLSKNMDIHTISLGSQVTMNVYNKGYTFIIDKKEAFLFDRKAIVLDEEQTFINKATNWDFSLPNKAITAIKKDMIGFYGFEAYSLLLTTDKY